MDRRGFVARSLAAVAAIVLPSKKKTINPATNIMQVGWARITIPVRTNSGLREITVDLPPGARRFSLHGPDGMVHTISTEI